MTQSTLRFELYGSAAGAFADLSAGAVPTLIAFARVLPPDRSPNCPVEPS